MYDTTNGKTYIYRRHGNFPEYVNMFYELQIDSLIRATGIDKDEARDLTWKKWKIIEEQKKYPEQYRFKWYLESELQIDDNIKESNEN